ncbi:myotubularin-related protein 10-like isoform X3 [Apostichopus japonicus]|uniref:myotubularin-related protein 10-like isoform X3 n=1 Tax=Stichopus japonicus TaxID=307972 RepID=UPI003AB21BF4
MVLVSGELIIRQAPNVLKFDTFSGQKRGITGSLTCTNFKISFVSANKPTVKTTGLDQRNALYKDNDIPLTFVRSIFQVTGKSKKQLTRNSSTAVSSSSKILEIRTKNFKVFTFSFKFTPEHDMKSIIQTILHHAYPSNINLLFAFAFQLPSDSESNQNRSNKIHAENGVSNRHSHSYDGSLPSIRFNSEWGSKRASSPPTPPPKPVQGQKDWTTGKTPTYRNMKDWQDETSRWGKQNLKVTAVNTDYMMCESLPEYFVVPAGLYDGELQKWAPCFIGHRVPIWCWSSSSGCSLFRMVHLNSEIDTDEATKRMLQSIADIHAHGTAKDYPVVTDLEKVCPSTKDILVSFQKLQDLCTVASMKEFISTETKWFSALENCKWLQHISACLERSKIVATQLDDKKSVVLRESSGRDLSCVISCLTQIMLDPYYRTQLGFQSLVQREWVATGHDFLVRSGHCTESTEDVSPVFLLFLDCVFQLMRQYPMAFEFNDTFLIILWDSLHTCIFDTFIFSNERHRTKVCNPNHSYQIKMVSVWAWTLQFSQVDQNLFSNPLYLIRDDLDMYRSKLDVAPLLNDRESCNTGIYRGIVQQSHKSPPLLSATDGSQVGLVGERSSMASSGSQTSETKTVEAINRVLLPQCTAPCIQFWIHCYLRWVPSAHILGGGEVGIFHQYCCLIGEIQELFKRLEELNEEEQPSLKTRCHSEKIFLTSFEDLTKNQECLTSAFPFTNNDLELLGSDRQSFVSTSLAKFLQGQSLLDTDMDVPQHMTDASSDEVDL